MRPDPGRRYPGAERCPTPSPPPPSAPRPPQATAPPHDDGAAATRRLRRTVAALLSTLSLVSALGAAVVGTAATVLVGPWLVMGAAILAGNTEPTVPTAAYPWTAVALGLAGLAGGALLVRGEKRARTGHILVHGAALFLALLPLWHLLTLWRRIPPP